MPDSIAPGKDHAFLRQQKEQWERPSIRDIVDLALTHGGKGTTRLTGEVGLSENPS